MLLSLQILSKPQLLHCMIQIWQTDSQALSEKTKLIHKDIEKLFLISPLTEEHG